MQSNNFIICYWIHAIKITHSVSSASLLNSEFEFNFYLQFRKIATVYKSSNLYNIPDKTQTILQKVGEGKTGTIK